jgi:hypothetical protein
MPANTANNRPAGLDEETQRLLNQTTARIVNHAVERRVDHVVRSSAAEQRVGRALWPVALAIAVLVLAGSLGWLLRGTLS